MWSLYNKKDEFLAPLKYSNGKTQENVVEDVLDAVDDNYKIIFIKGTPGSGKSAVALNVAKEFSKSSIVVPVKYLQKQYEHDYASNLYLKRDNGEKLKISVITGRNNHRCMFDKSKNADFPLLPCIIQLRKENLDMLRQYVKINKDVDPDDFVELKDFTRTAVACACPKWSPIVSKEFAENTGIDSDKIYYNAIKSDVKCILKREHGCSYYNQFEAYKNADVIIFNSRKYELENLMERKPATDIEIIDEGDEFLDKLSNERKINLNYLLARLKRVGEAEKNEDVREAIFDLMNIVDGLIKHNSGSKIMKLEENRAIDLLDYFLRNSYLAEHEELESYYEAILTFGDFKESTYVCYNKNNKNETVLEIVNIDLKRKLDEFLTRNKAFVFMSGTMHSKKVLREMFGINEYKLIEAETKEYGNIKKVFTKKEGDFRYRYFENGKYKREDYLRALDASIGQAKRPVLVHVNSYSDLPTEQEKNVLKLNLLSQESFVEMQEKGKRGELLQLFKDGKIDELYSTKCNRGVDFPGEMCNSIVFTKYPYPSMHDLFWQVLKRERPDEYFSFYMDKAFREYKQRIYRGLRSENDSIFLLSPDVKVLS